MRRKGSLLAVSLVVSMLVLSGVYMVKNSKSQNGLVDANISYNRVEPEETGCLMSVSESANVITRSWSSTGGGDHGGANWAPNNGDNIAGLHTNISTFSISNGVTVNVKPYDGNNFGFIEIHADLIIIEGILNGDSAGYLGGPGGQGRDWHFGGYKGINGTGPGEGQEGANGGNGDDNGGGGGGGRSGG